MGNRPNGGMVVEALDEGGGGGGDAGNDNNDRIINNGNNNNNNHNNNNNNNVSILPRSISVNSNTSNSNSNSNIDPNSNPNSLSIHLNQLLPNNRNNNNNNLFYEPVMNPSVSPDFNVNPANSPQNHNYLSFSNEYDEKQHYYYQPTNPWAHTQPEDVYFTIFSFLSQRGLCRVSLVNHSWHSLVYDPSLWKILHLCKIYTRIDDLLIEHTFKSGRFKELETLCLDNCSAITYRSIETIAEYCPRLKALSLANCERINPYLLIDFIQRMPTLRKLELIGVTSDYLFAKRLLNIRPKLDLGLYYVEYCAESGIKLQIDQNKLGFHAERRYSIELDATHNSESESKTEEKSMATCRYQGRMAGNDRGCWGKVKGRIIWSSNFYHTAGNFPSLVLYSCENHSEEDFSDETYFRCRMCEKLFVKESMWSAMICKLCFDIENLSNKQHWINLMNQKELKQFGFTQVVNQTVRIADRKNIPNSLRSFGSTVCRLDYTGENKESIIDPTQVPFSIFLDSNATRLDQTMHNLRGKLKTAREAGNIRALLVLDSDENIEILADERVIADGQEGEQYLRMTQQAWRNVLYILYPVAIIIAISSHFSNLFNESIQSQPTGTTNYTAYIRSPSSDSIDPIVLIGLGAGLIIFLLTCAFLFFKFRQLFESLFKKFLVLDIFAIYCLGTGVIFYTFFQWVNAYFDWFSFALVIANFSALCVAALYLHLFHLIHKISVASLNAYLAILLAGTLGKWFCLAVGGFVALMDFLTELRGNLRLLTPFLVPDAMIITTTPRILFSISGLHVRPIDLMLFGLLSILTDSITIALVLILGTLCISVFISPYLVGKRRFLRPVPIMFVLFLIFTFAQYDLIQAIALAFTQIR